MNPRVAAIVAAGLLVSSVSFAAGPGGHLNPADSEHPPGLPEEIETAGSVTCSFTSGGLDLMVTVNQAQQRVHTGGDFCADYNLTGTVKKATTKKVKASNLNGATTDTHCCETMHIDSIKYSKKKGSGKMSWRFLCDGAPAGPFTANDLTCQ